MHCSPSSHCEDVPADARETVVSPLTNACKLRTPSCGDVFFDRSRELRLPPDLDGTGLLWVVSIASADALDDCAEDTWTLTNAYHEYGHRWRRAGKRIKQIMADKENGESTATTRQSRPKTRPSFAKRVAASVTKAARMPIDMPKEDTKIVMRPRGGLNVARTEVSIIMSAVMTAARVTKEDAKADTICTNAQQNIIVVSTPDERRATLYSKVKALNIGDRTYEISAYRTALDGTVKGVIRGIAVDDTPKEMAENLQAPTNR
ncbi:uncharacterized protein LOC144108634 [Amblyomma americanum]